ncbi:unnamed protein product [Lepeophtheirus salmonis]|uniref:(salmon louse) hypothetical protein n=1 Tax=Lepeophtheirus salmonis TaxID=72036 RepID=A0A7R8CZJ6_LEPSM|nr:unnamed protein product [Lepeophtheirus salmonis]CAF2975423.1 unnamed protein product [Lepeophtheirus salmonis]
MTLITRHSPNNCVPVSLTKLMSTICLHNQRRICPVTMTSLVRRHESAIFPDVFSPIYQKNLIRSWPCLVPQVLVQDCLKPKSHPLFQPQMIRELFRLGVSCFLEKTDWNKKKKRIIPRSPSPLTKGASSLNLKDLPTSICELRKAILDVMVDQGLLLHSEAMEIYDNPKDEMHRRSSRTHLLYNFLWLPEHLRMGTCFVDFINFYCDDAEYLDELLQSKLRPSHQTDKIDPPPKEKLSSSVKAMDVIEGKYYSFCLGRVVHEDEISHCARCRACFDHRYWHCDHCDRCSLGMSIGVCEHCGYRDVNESSGDSDEMSVCSVSELQ